MIELPYTKKEIKANAEETAMRLLERIGLSDKADVYPSTLSGGQRQRVAIARALMSNPQILLCDEATSALDPDTTNQILTLLTQLNRDFGLTIIMISHQMDVIEKICNKVAIIDKAQIVESGNAQDIFLFPKRNELSDYQVPDESCPFLDIWCQVI